MDNNFERIGEILASEFGADCIVYPDTKPIDGLGGWGPNLEEMFFEFRGEVHCGKNIFEIEGRDDKHDLARRDKYNLPVRHTEGLTLGLGEEVER